MEPIYMAAVVLAFIAIGEIASIVTKARVPALLVAMLGIFAFAQLGIVPKTAIDDSLLPQVYAILVVPTLFHMGSLIPLPQMVQQWKAILIAVGGMVVAVGLLAAVVIPLFGFGAFVAGAGPLAGGILATSIATEGIQAAGLAPALVILPALVLMMQSLPSMPLTNLLLRKFAIAVRDSGELEKLAGSAKTVETGERKKLVNLPKSLEENELFVLFVILVGGAVATLLAVPTHIPATILALLLGIASTAVGITPQRSMERASSFGIAMAAVIAIVMAPLVAANMADVIAALAALAVIIIVGGAGIMLGGLIVTKIVGWKAPLGMSVALTAMYGFPADYLLTNEVARSVGRDEKERKQLTDAMLPAMLVGGFTSVSAGSVIISSVLVSFL